MDCPRCEQKLQGLMNLKKHERIKLQRRYQGGIITSIKGDTRSQDCAGLGQIPPNGMTVTDRCKSCGWTSIRVYNAGNRKWEQQVEHLKI